MCLWAAAALSTPQALNTVHYGGEHYGIIDVYGELPSPSNNSDLKVMGLTPMAVAPAHQRKGIGSALVRAGLEQCRKLDFDAVVVLGHPEYYPRFGFSPSSRFGVESEYDVPEEVFMALELRPNALSGRSAVARYHSAFGDL